MSESAEPVAGAAPPMPRPSPRSFGDLPLQTGSNSTLGIKVKSRGNAFYFLAASGGLRRYGRRFALTEEGWIEAWNAFSVEDPAGAALYRASLESDSARPPMPAGVTSSTDDTSDDSWMWILLGGAGWVGAAALAYEGVSHASVMLVLIGAVLAFCSLVATLYGLLVEGVRLARRTSTGPRR